MKCETEVKKWLEELTTYMTGEKQWDTGCVWVCENHPLLPCEDQGYSFDCNCGGAGMQPFAFLTHKEKHERNDSAIGNCDTCLHSRNDEEIYDTLSCMLDGSPSEVDHLDSCESYEKQGGDNEI